MSLEHVKRRLVQDLASNCTKHSISEDKTYVKTQFDLVSQTFSQTNHNYCTTTLNKHYIE